jgi:hypothetical protein
MAGNPIKLRLPSLDPSLVGRISAEMIGKNKELGRALPDSKGAETPKQLQTYRTWVTTFFTLGSVESELLYSAENWVRIRVSLQTAGPVAIGTVSEIVPVLSGKGIILDPDDDPWEAMVPKGTRVYVASETVNRLDVTVDPIPWLEQMDLDVVKTQNDIRDAVAKIGNDIVAAISALRSGQAMPATQPAKPPPPPVLPRAVPVRVPRLTGMVMPRKIGR